MSKNRDVLRILSLCTERLDEGAMPILEVEVVGECGEVAKGIADAVAAEFADEEWRVWVRLRRLDAKDYAESEGGAYTPVSCRCCRSRSVKASGWRRRWRGSRAPWPALAVGLSRACT
jgi:hypothetical protein